MSTNQPSSGLAAVAATMKRQASQAQSRHSFRRLQHGLALVYGQRDDHWHLAIGRLAPDAPSDQELQTVAAAFRIPIDFEPIHRQVQWWDPIDERNRTYNVLEITWRENRIGGCDKLSHRPTGGGMMTTNTDPIIILLCVAVLLLSVVNCVLWRRLVSSQAIVTLLRQLLESNYALACLNEDLLDTPDQHKPLASLLSNQVFSKN